ncbi:hypothetical protein PM082_011050 [Marasmius tenuissimus]|nr:hypothetical protein PM082_011070 [Marasmius tenuissimus]KAJ8085388.1 hypothetical protein PM082_011050 [Marasmius tenuissimus]
MSMSSLVPSPPQDSDLIIWLLGSASPSSTLSDDTLALQKFDLSHLNAQES